MADLKVNFMGIEFKNPVIAASGTFGFGQEYNEVYDVGLLGGISSKGLTLNRKEGNDGIRLWETPMGLMNSIGLQNPGVEEFISREIIQMKKLGTVIIANLGGGCEEDYMQGAKMLNHTDIDILELNISCPNVKAGGMAFGIKAGTAYDIVKKIKNVTLKPLMVKMSPNAENISEMAAACEEAGADSLSLTNTFKAMAIDINKRKPVFENIYAGLSGPAIKPIALRMVHEVSKAVNIPVCGIGGISDYKDVLEFMMAGATTVQIGTANFANPLACMEIIENLNDYLEKNNIKNIREIIGII